MSRYEENSHKITKRVKHNNQDIGNIKLLLRGLEEIISSSIKLDKRPPPLPPQLLPMHLLVMA